MFRQLLGQAAMDVGFSLRLDAEGAMRTAVVSAERLQLSLKSELSQEEQALTKSNGSLKETREVGYCTSPCLSGLFFTLVFYS